MIYHVHRSATLLCTSQKVRAIQLCVLSLILVTVVTPCEHASPLTRLDRLNRLNRLGRYARIPSGSRRSFAPRSPASRREIEILVSDRYGRDKIPPTFVICLWLEPISVASSYVTWANLPKDLHLASIFDPGPQLHILHRNKSPSHFHSLTSTDRLCTLELQSHA